MENTDVTFVTNVKNKYFSLTFPESKNIISSI